MRKNSFHFAVTNAIVALFITGPTNAATYAGWLKQIGVNDTNLSASNWGKGALIGVIDTGINPNHPVFATGQVSKSLSKCSAVSFVCSNSFNDDAGHGTAVSSVIAANIGSPLSQVNLAGYITKPGDRIGLASQANIASFKVLNSSGSGRSTDVASGLRDATNAGASVVNLSITFGNSPDIVSAINYAASKGVTIVWAAGNEKSALLKNANTIGLTKEAIDRILFVGSVNSKNVASSFSNNAGTGNLIATNGQMTAYSKKWLVAPGEGILAPQVLGGDRAWSAWNGTSFAAPLASGSIVLVQTAWPILRNNGTADDLLLATALDLGPKGIDSQYGAGLIDLNKAFQPYGALTVKNSNKQDIPVTSLTGKSITQGALGNLNSVKALLSNYTSFDSFQRNFTVNLSGLLVSANNRFSLNPLPVNQVSRPNALKFQDGTELTMLEYKQPEESELLGLTDFEKSALVNNIPVYALVNSKSGETIGSGRGYPSAFAYSRALSGEDDISAMSSNLNSFGLSSLADGGAFFVYGNKLSDNSRFAFGYSQSANQIDNYNPSQFSRNINIGVSQKITNETTASVNLSFLNEKNSFLSSSYNETSLINLGENNQTRGISFALNTKIGQRSGLLLESGMSYTKDSVSDTGIVNGVSNVLSTSYGASLISNDFLQMNDSLLLSVKQPLRVESGSTSVQEVSVDQFGLPIYANRKLGLEPDGREITINSTYSMNPSRNETISFTATYSKDLMNIAGQNNASASVFYSLKF